MLFMSKSLRRLDDGQPSSRRSDDDYYTGDVRSRSRGMSTQGPVRLHGSSYDFTVDQNPDGCSDGTVWYHRCGGHLLCPASISIQIVYGRCICLYVLHVPTVKSTLGGSLKRLCLQVPKAFEWHFQTVLIESPQANGNDTILVPMQKVMVSIGPFLQWKCMLIGLTGKPRFCCICAKTIVVANVTARPIRSWDESFFVHVGTRCQKRLMRHFLTRGPVLL